MTAEIQRSVHIGVGMVLIAVIPVFIFQIYLFKRLKKNASNLVALSFTDVGNEEQENTNA